MRVIIIDRFQPVDTVIKSIVMLAGGLIKDHV